MFSKCFIRCFFHSGLFYADIQIIKLSCCYCLFSYHFGFFSSFCAQTYSNHHSRRRMSRYHLSKTEVKLDYRQRRRRNWSLKNRGKHPDPQSTFLGSIEFVFLLSIPFAFLDSLQVVFCDKCLCPGETCFPTLWNAHCEYCTSVGLFSLLVFLHWFESNWVPVSARNASGN